MSDDWQVGDLALCVDASARSGIASGLTMGRIYTVSGVGPESLSWYEDATLPALYLCEVRAPKCCIGYDPRRFRKLRPLTDEERTQAIADLRIPQRVRA